MGSVYFAKGLRDGDTLAVLGERGNVTYGRWSGGPADTLSIEFDVQHATRELQDDRLFRAALERAGKTWSRRIADTWQEWEREAGEWKGQLIGDQGRGWRELFVGPEGETSNGLVIYVTDVDLDTGGHGGPDSILPGNDWEPHTGVIAFDLDYFEEAAREDYVFHTMVHEIGHVLGAWDGREFMETYAPFTDFDAGTWTGPNVVAEYGGHAPFQDDSDRHGWHDGERHPDASTFDFAHSGICASVMAYCTQSDALPAFLPAEVDFAFLGDLGLTIRPETERPETYGLAGWLEHSAFTISVFRELDVSLADPQSRYFMSGAPWTDLDTVDLLWAEVDAFGRQSTGSPATSFPLLGTVSYAGGLIGTAVDLRGLPPVYGDANLSVDLAELRGKASFTSLETAYDGERYVFGDGSLHYPISVKAQFANRRHGLAIAASRQALGDG